MRCRKCGRFLADDAVVCDLCATPVYKRGMTRAEAEEIARKAKEQMPAARRSVRVTRVAAPARQSFAEAEAAAEEAAWSAARKERCDDIIYGILVTLLILLALVSASLCVLLLTRGTDPAQWFEKPAVTARPSAEAALPTPDQTKTGAASLPTPTGSAAPLPTQQPTPTPAPTSTPTPAPTTAAEGRAALEALLLEGIERNYTQKELETLSADELSLLRNGMYAYSGLSFKKAKFKDFFGACDWYEPNTSDDERVYKRMNDHQKKNVETILSIEKRKGYR